MTTAYERTKKWALANPEKVRDQRRRRLERQKNDPEWKARRAAYLRSRSVLPEVRQRKRATMARYHAKNPDKVKGWNEERRLERAWSMLLAKARIRARESGLEFTLSKQWALERWTGHCELTGIPFVLITGTTRTHPHSASLGRIDSAKGYTPENCRFILWALNRFKADGTDDDMRAIAAALLRSPQ